MNFPSRARECERGFTLIETVVTVAIVALLCIAATVIVNPSAAQRTAAVRSFADYLADTRSLALANADQAAGPGATLVITAVAGKSTLTVYRGEPSNPPQLTPETSLPPLQTDATIALADSAVLTSPAQPATSLALIVDPTGALSYAPGYDAAAGVTGSPQRCPPATGIPLQFTLAGRTTTMTLECDAATLHTTGG